MTRLTIYFMKFFIAILAAIFATSCNVKIDGLENLEIIDPSGDIVIKEVNLNEDFTDIKISNGLNLILTQNPELKTSIEAEENLHPHIHTYIKDNTLYIKSDKNISSDATKNIYVSAPIIKSLKASSASNINGVNTLKSKHFEIETSSGATINLDVIAENLILDTSSASEIIISGKVKNFDAEASSGSSMNLENLLTKDAKAEASSAGTIKLQVLNQLDASASSGATIYYLKTPKSINLNTSSGGYISSY